MSAKTIHPLAGKPAPASLLVNVPKPSARRASSRACCNGRRVSVALYRGTRACHEGLEGRYTSELEQAADALAGERRA